MKHVFPTLILALIYLTPALVGIVLNRMDPNMASALTVAYLAAGGVVLGVIATGIDALLSMQWAAFKPNYVIVAACLALSILIFILANSGMLSVVQ